MLRDLLFNFCLTVTLAYGISLTYRTGLAASRRLRWLRAGLAGLMPVVLISFPATLAPGIQMDLRSVPVMFVTLRYGPGAGLLASAPALLLRAYQGGVGVPVALVSMLGVILAASWVRRHVRFDPRDSWNQVPWSLALLMFVPNGLAIGLLPGGPDLLKSAYLPLLLANVGAFLLAGSILDGRRRLLELTRSWQERAQHDHLSGLANRRQFDADLATLGQHDLLLLLDIDHFKRVNDDYGHPVGDQLLIAIGQALPVTLRQTDRAYRYGGEEFAVILRMSAPHPPDLVAERLRRQIEALSFPQLQGGGVTISIGVARGVPDDAQATLRRADEALYAAKAAGRNRVQVWTPVHVAASSGPQPVLSVPA